MKKPEPSINEQQRLKNIEALEILDTPAEERFDRLTRLARRLFDVPIALVSIVDANRQWFKSCMGLEMRETSRDISFCGHAILGGDVFVIPDTSMDERFQDNPMVTRDPYIRFYAGCPLSFHDGSKLGTLCILDRTPRVFTGDDIKSLKDIASMAEREINASHLAVTDELTGILNRRGFIITAQNALQFCARLKLPSVLLYFDLDKFKEINDTFDRQEGDLALMAFAKSMSTIFRESDVVARIGGDEFVAFLPDSNVANTRKAIERFKAEVDKHNSVARHTIRYSAGVLVMNFHKNKTIEELLVRADAMMHAKKSR